MTRTILISSILLAAAIIGLKILEYSFINDDLHIGIYIGVLITVAAIVGVWIGREFFARRKTIIQNGTPEMNTAALRDYGLSKRETEILGLIEKGYTNQKIADTLFVSLSTVKSHTSNIYTKLSVKNRTQAIAKAKEIGTSTKV